MATLGGCIVRRACKLRRILPRIMVSKVPAPIGVHLAYTGTLMQQTNGNHRKLSYQKWNGEWGDNQSINREVIIQPEL